MNSINLIFWGAVINACVLGLAIFAIQRMLVSFTNKVEQSIKELKVEDDRLWQALNTHGHKGLDVNGARVTR